MARTLRLDLLSRTNIAGGSDLPITSWMVRHAAWLLSHFQTGSADGKTAYARQFEKPYESLVLPFAERVMWKDPTRSRKAAGVMVCGWGETSNAHLIGTRVGIVVARTIRRLPTSEREDSNLVVAMRGTPVAGPADAAAGDAPTVTRHAVEHREVVMVPASSGAPLQAGSGEGISTPSNPVPNLPKPTVARAQPVESSHHPSGERVDSSGPGGDVPMEVAQVVEPTTKSHAPVEVHDESLVPKSPRRTVGQLGDLPNETCRQTFARVLPSKDGRHRDPEIVP